jgi:hypothetical protein
MKIHKIKAKIKNKTYYPKGFYYQGEKHIVLVGCTIKNHTIRQKFFINEVELIIE